MEHIPCEQQEYCPLQETKRGCFMDVHHEYYPAADYRTKTEQTFRELDCNKVFVCRAIHNAVHAELPYPVKPERAKMLEVIMNNTIDKKPKAV